MILELILDKLLLVEYLTQVFLWIIIQLNEERSTIVRKSLKTMPSTLLSFSRLDLLKNLKRRLIFSFYEDLKILAG